jgi:epoxyqueuosine reductase
MILTQEFLDSLGIVDWGYTEEGEAKSYDRYSSWVDKGQATPLNYLTDHRKPLRENLQKIYPEFQSALIFLFSYRPTKKWMLENNNHRIASYALGFEGADYHDVLKERLHKITEVIKKDHPDLETFQSLDAQPVLERDLAYRAGLGWFGKNSMLISRKEGSYFIIGSLLLNKKLELKARTTDIDHCGTCTACADACPTDAIDLETRTLKASQCISTFTIELMKEAGPPKGFEMSRGEIFGCDICQDVCPWNGKPLERTKSELTISRYPVIEKFLLSPLSELRALIDQNTGRGIQRLLKGTALARPGKKGWMKNV